MPFIGTPVVTQITDRQVRITGVAIAAAGSATIGLSTATGTPPDLLLPVPFAPRPYDYEGQTITIPDQVSVDLNLVDLVGNNSPVGAGKTGTTPQNFRIVIAAGAASDTPQLEIYVRIHD